MGNRRSWSNIRPFRFLVYPPRHGAVYSWLVWEWECMSVSVWVSLIWCIGVRVLYIRLGYECVTYLSVVPTIPYHTCDVTAADGSIGACMYSDFISFWKQRKKINQRQKLIVFASSFFFAFKEPRTISTFLAINIYNF